MAQTVTLTSACLLLLLACTTLSGGAKAQFADAYKCSDVEVSEPSATTPKGTACTGLFPPSPSCQIFEVTGCGHSAIYSCHWAQSEHHDWSSCQAVTTTTYVA